MLRSSLAEANRLCETLRQRFGCGAMLLALGLLGLAAPASGETYGLGTNPLGTVTYSAGAAIATIGTQKTGLEFRIQPYGGSSQLVPLVNSGEIDFGMCNILEGTDAYEGADIFKGHPSPDIRVVGVVFPLHSGLMVRNNSDIHTIKDLKGRAIPVGYTSQLILRPLLNGELATAGLTLADVKGVPVPNIVRGADEFESGTLDAFFFAVGAAREAQANASVAGGIRLLPIENSPAALAAMRKYAPPAYLQTLQPGPHTPSVRGPTPVLTYDYLLIANSKAKDEVVYKLVKALHDSQKDLATTFGVFNEFKPDDMAKKFPIPYHPGAIKYYTEIGKWPPPQS